MTSEYLPDVCDETPESCSSQGCIDKGALCSSVLESGTKVTLCDNISKTGILTACQYAVMPRAISLVFA